MGHDSDEIEKTLLILEVVGRVEDVVADLNRQVLEARHQELLRRILSLGNLTLEKMRREIEEQQN